MSLNHHPLDPRTIDFAPPQRFIYGDDWSSIGTAVEEDDYQYFIQWKWNWKKDPNGKMYLRRAVGVNVDGERLSTHTLYLHVEIHKRRGIRPPTPRHVIVDHKDGSTLNCMHPNLRWTTPAGNVWNKFGKAAYPSLFN